MIKNQIKKIIHKLKWKNVNKHNDTISGNIFPIEKVKVGKKSYGALYVFSWGAENEGLVIGNWVSIASNVKFILGGNHYINTFSTYPYKVRILGESKEAWSKGPIVVEDDVWIGMDVIILSGVKIGQGAVVAAGSVVSKDVPAYSVVAGNPANMVKFRFEKEMINELKELDYTKINKSFIEKNIDLLYEPLSDQNFKIIKKNLR